MQSSRIKSDTAVIESRLEILELHEKEVELIKNLRTKFRFGEVTIIMRDGIPFRLRRITEFADL